MLQYSAEDGPRAKGGHSDRGRRTARFDPKQPVVAGENISRPRSRADDQVSVIRRKRPAGFGGRLLSWLMAYGHENSPRSGLDDTIDELAILHAPLAKPSDRLP